MRWNQQKIYTLQRLTSQRFRRSSCLEKMAQRKWKHCNQSLVPCLIAGNLVLQLIFVKVSITYLRGYLLCFGRTLVISISASSKFWRKTPVFIVVKSRFRWMSFNYISLNANEIKREETRREFCYMIHLYLYAIIKIH